jgi:hypothetical protein
VRLRAHSKTWELGVKNDKTVINQFADAVKTAASKFGQVATDAAGSPPTDKVCERIVPIPEVSTYSEVPFARVDSSRIESKTRLAAKKSAAAASKKKPSRRSKLAKTKSAKKKTR